VGTMRHRAWIATLACVAIGLALVYCLHFSKQYPDEKRVLAAEDEVYEAVVRDIVAPPGHRHAPVSELVFDDTVSNSLTPGTDIKSCEERARWEMRLENSKLPYDSLADKIYRALAGSGYDGSLRADTIQDFPQKSCTVGRLSQTFHTDLPRTFIAVESVSFDYVPIEKKGPPLFKQQYPGAGGIIAFSHVGFDPTLHEAIVSVSFVCGGLCGSGNRYVLRKKSGRWEVVNRWMVWIS